MPDYNNSPGQDMMEWPYQVNYGKENEFSTDVLVIGGGIAGCHAAINAVKKGAKVAVVDKAPIVRSGSGGAGVDHWHGTIKNPCAKGSPDDMEGQAVPPYSMGHLRYIINSESWDSLLDIEKMGVRIRDEDDDFVGAPFRDEKTKLLFAYDYDKCDTIRVQGADIKPAMYKELKKLDVDMFEHIMVTKLLTEGGVQGARVVGAAGIHIRTGEFFIFKAKAVILATAQPLRIWVFNTELVGSNTAHDDPNLAGDGNAMGWLAGAELSMMERSMAAAGAFRYPAYGTGNAHNTWFACTIVDSNGKVIPWVDSKGKPLKTVEDRYHAGGMAGPGPSGRGVRLIPDLPERIMKGEYVLPFYADLPSMSEHERRAIFGLMVGHEGKTRIPLYENYTQAGFDPDKDMLMANVLPPKIAGQYGGWWGVRMGPPQWRETAFNWGGGLMVDWDMKTSIEGLYSAGNQTAGGGGHAGAAATGRYTGRTAAAFAGNSNETVLYRKQIDDEKIRVYKPVNQEGEIGWKELQAGVCRIMQDYCGEYRGEKTLKMGLWWLNSIRESEAQRTRIRNPHELARYQECMVKITIGEIMMHASLARKASSQVLDFKRLDYPETDPPEWDKFVTVRLEGEDVKTGELPLDYWLQAPYAPTYKENYDKHCAL